MRSVVVLAGILLFAGAASAATFTATAKETGCPAGRTFCFDAPATVEVGGVVTLTLKNSGATVHELVAVPGADADANHSATSEDNAYGAVEDVEAGQEASADVTIPAGVTQVYFFCALPGHETLGMWFTAQGTPAAPADAEKKSPTPLPGILAVGALVAAAAFLARRR